MDPEELQEKVIAHGKYLEEMQALAEKQATEIRKMKRELAKISEETISPEEEAA